MHLMAIYSLSTLLMVALLVAKKYSSAIGEWLTKPALSLLFILVAVLQMEGWSNFNAFMLAGFICCFLGDVFLIQAGKIMFLAGLVSFLIGHLLYIAAFTQYASMTIWLVLPGIVILLADFAVYTWLKDYIHDMAGSIVSYLIVISVMVFAASTVAVNGNFGMTGRALLLGGAVSFFVSDLFVVRERFVSKSFTNHALGLPLYYVGQFALAISIGYL